MKDLNYSMVEKVLASISEHNIPSIDIKVVVKDLQITDSKFGGFPYIPRSVGSAPKTSEGKLLILLAQFNISQLPKNIFPSDTGILQFFIDCTDDLYGSDFDNWTNTNRFKAIFYPNIEEDFLSTDELKEIYKDCRTEYSPIDDGEWGLEFTETIASLSCHDYRFSGHFVTKWNELYPENNITSFFDLPDDLSDEIWDNLSGYGHKLFGYPAFAQTDPREYTSEYQEFELLFQMDSDFGSDVPQEIMWGDSGVGNFFIKRDDLAKLDFSNVGYTWDCD